ncbi:MAG: hypothetical protein OEZ23_09410, partial [Gammaproteobacteria bacterium]|nr:hypothetical protein [Gammaproteobacteria bacterium]
PPPADCTTADCRRIHEHWARETSLEDVLSSTLKDYKNTQARTRNAQHVAIRSQHPTILDYLQTTESSFLCIELSLAEKNETDFISSMRDLYHLDGPQLVYRAIMLELAGRFQVSQGSLERLLRQPASIWKGMPESLLNCSRPEPDLIYDTTDVFGIKKKQYVYEIKPDFEYVDIYDGKITRIQKVPIAHSPLTTDD